MKSVINISLVFLAFFSFCCGCHSKTEVANEESGKKNATQNREDEKQSTNISEDDNKSEPITCVDWISFYGETTRQLDRVVKINDIKIKHEGYDQYNSSDKLEGIYVLKDKKISIARIGDLAKCLAYKLCLSDNKKFKGILMDCQKRKVQVVIARTEKNYTNEAWAVVYNVFPANKKGELIILDFIK